MTIQCEPTTPTRPSHVTCTSECIAHVDAGSSVQTNVSVAMTMIGTLITACTTPSMTTLARVTGSHSPMAHTAMGVTTNTIARFRIIDGTLRSGEAWTTTTPVSVDEILTFTAESMAWIAGALVNVRRTR